LLWRDLGTSNRSIWQREHYEHSGSPGYSSQSISPSKAAHSVSMRSPTEDVCRPRTCPRPRPQRHDSGRVATASLDSSAWGTRRRRWSKRRCCWPQALMRFTLATSRYKTLCIKLKVGPVLDVIKRTERITTTRQSRKPRARMPLLFDGELRSLFLDKGRIYAPNSCGHPCRSLVRLK